MRTLKEALLREYGSFADKRIKNIDKGSRFLVDDRHDGGLASDGTPYGRFCSISAEVTDADTVRVVLSNLPEGPSVAAWAGAMGITGSSARTELAVTRETLGLLTGLAEAIWLPERPGTQRRATNTLAHARPIAWTVSRERLLKLGKCNSRSSERLRREAGALSEQPPRRGGDGSWTRETAGLPRPPCSWPSEGVLRGPLGCGTCRRCP